MGARASASCLSRRAPEAAAELEHCAGPTPPRGVPKAARSRLGRPAGRGDGQCRADAREVAGSRSAPVLLPTRPHDDGDLPRAGLHGPGDAAAAARPARARRAGRHVTFGGEELKHFEVTVGRMRSVR
ncbi:unnamed protein product [Prorocentrum cordatum]|uniref:Uncharacterized protein n=1 Tax=Prorocentrum cordatum TaxID=2364126 RepID=A0ABN9V1U5_9DINO|nr:unnamed protein product [Polarella glacialis]